jgi:GntR family transcriptional regulator/MocR family aminotransferase
LETEGYIACAAGGAAEVTADAVASPRRESALVSSSRAKRFAPVPPRGLLAPGTPSLDDFPRGRWLQCLERAWSSCDDHALRRAIATHVCPMRGIVAAEEEIVIAANREEALACAAQLLADPGDLVLLEDPSDPRTRALFDAQGLRRRADRVDADGLAFDANGEAPRLVHVTPSRQFPAGVQMSLGRQYLLLQWAKSIGATILEEDRDLAWNDGDARAIKAADNDGRVVYIGSFEKVLHPHAAVAFLVLPPELVALAENILAPPQSTLHNALAMFIEQGDLARHIQRMRSIHAERREALVRELHRRLAGAIEGVMRGAALDVVLWLAPHLDDLAIVAQCEGITPMALNSGVAPASGQPLKGRPAAGATPAAVPPALILGYGAVTPGNAAVAVAQLARAIEKSGLSRLRA